MGKIRLRICKQWFCNIFWAQLEQKMNCFWLRWAMFFLELNEFCGTSNKSGKWSFGPLWVKRCKFSIFELLKFLDTFQFNSFLFWFTDWILWFYLKYCNSSVMSKVKSTFSSLLFKMVCLAISDLIVFSLMANTAALFIKCC